MSKKEKVAGVIEFPVASKNSKIGDVVMIDGVRGKVADICNGTIIISTHEGVKTIKA